jgi:hypothetical protein
MWLRNNQTTRQNVCVRRGFYGSIARERGRGNGTEMLVDVDVDVSRFWFWVEDLIEDVPFLKGVAMALYMVEYWYIAYCGAEGKSSVELW